MWYNKKVKILDLIYISDNDLDFFNRIRSKSNKIFVQKTKNYYFYDVLAKRLKKINFKFNKIKMDSDVLQQLGYKIFTIVSKSHQQVINFVKSYKVKSEVDWNANFDFNADYNARKLYKDILLWLTDLSYHQRLDIINICCWVPFKILSKQIWGNGNKRTALTACINLLKSFSLYLSYSKNAGLTDEAKNRWYGMIVEYVKRIENEKGNYYNLYDSFYNELTKGVFFDVYSIKDE